MFVPLHPIQYSPLFAHAQGPTCSSCGLSHPDTICRSSARLILELMIFSNQLSSFQSQRVQNDHWVVCCKSACSHSSYSGFYLCENGEKDSDMLQDKNIWYSSAFQSWSKDQRGTHCLLEVSTQEWRRELGVIAYMSHRPCPSLRGKSGAKYSQRTHYISLVRILEPEMLCRRMETYKPPTQKTADRSTLSLELNLSFQISGCGRHNMTKSSTILIDPSAI